MAYAALAHLNAVVGLYTSLFPTIIYVIFGTSRHITLGMFAVAALMTGSALERRMEVAAFAILQLHFITVYLADPVVGGFTTGAACHVFASQMPKLIGVRIPPRHGPLGLFKIPYFLFDFALSLKRTNVYVLIMSLISITILMSGKYLINPPVQQRIRVPIPFELLPIPALPDFRHFAAFLLDAFLIAVVIYSVTVSVGKVFAKKHNYQIRPSQELRAMALCQLVGGFLSCHPASGSLSRAVINSQLGATSSVSSLSS
ncbi:unnamed protein product [Gongylonema pulchrum]|uniref:Sulfate_transp domain-containing protein n=1 Tax=Gongylonema pulchrum TaxID=637853 RepID=A0A183EIV7_9BILA|nr:unnamed protein product [Gongylonema pulchrum]